MSTAGRSFILNRPNGGARGTTSPSFRECRALDTAPPGIFLTQHCRKLFPGAVVTEEGRGVRPAPCRWTVKN